MKRFGPCTVVRVLFCVSVLVGVCQAETAAQMMLSILRGKPIQELPVQKESPNRFVFDYPLLSHYQIP